MHVGRLAEAQPSRTFRKSPDEDPEVCRWFDLVLRRILESLNSTTGMVD
jgi:hypothetical protein